MQVALWKANPNEGPYAHKNHHMTVFIIPNCSSTKD